MFYLGIDIGKRHHLTPENSLIGLEATGHYWLSFFYLFTNQASNQPFLFHFSLMLYDIFMFEKKTEVSNAYLIAQVIRIDYPKETPFIEGNLLR